MIAHEIRNPLMIIKAALRPLAARARRTPAQVREAARDIERGGRAAQPHRQRGARLRSADPLRAAREADLAGAVPAGGRRGRGRRGRLPGGPAPARPTRQPLVTDAERLRGVLVNLLTNARQAVARRGDAAGPRASRESSSRSASPDRARRGDRGPRPRPRASRPNNWRASSSRSSRPRRGGTGLGLAIAGTSSTGWAAPSPSPASRAAGRRSASSCRRRGAPAPSTRARDRQGGDA